MDLIAILMGWPALITALVLSAFGAWFGKPALIWVGVVLVAPMAIYLSGSPGYRFVGAIPLLGLVASALSCRMRRKWPSAAGVVVYALFLAYLAYIVINQP